MSTRRPLPALIFLLGLSLLTALVWWRVIHRSDSGNAAAAAPQACPTTTASVVPQPAAVTVDVLNSTNRAHLARGVSTQLGKLGFHVSGYGNDDPNIVVNGVAEIRYGPKASQAATLLSFYLPGATLVPEQNSNTTVVVSLGTKYKAVATTAAATKAMQTKHITQLPKGAAAPTPSSPAPATC